MLSTSTSISSVGWKDEERGEEQINLTYFHFYLRLLRKLSSADTLFLDVLGNFSNFILFAMLFSPLDNSGARNLFVLGLFFFFF